MKKQLMHVHVKSYLYRNYMSEEINNISSNVHKESAKCKRLDIRQVEKCKRERDQRIREVENLKKLVKAKEIIKRTNFNGFRN
jgi:actin-related protein